MSCFEKVVVVAGEGKKNSQGCVRMQRAAEEAQSFLLIVVACQEAVCCPCLLACPGAAFSWKKPENITEASLPAKLGDTIFFPGFELSPLKVNPLRGYSSSPLFGGGLLLP